MNAEWELVKEVYAKLIGDVRINPLTIQLFRANYNCASEINRNLPPYWWASRITHKYASPEGFEDWALVNARAIKRKWKGILGPQSADVSSIDVVEEGIRRRFIFSTAYTDARDFLHFKAATEFQPEQAVEDLKTFAKDCMWGIFIQAGEEIAESVGASFECGDGDPTDWFLVWED